MVRPFFSLSGGIKYQYFFLFLLSALAILQAGTIDLHTDKTIAADQQYYRAIADAAPDINKTVLTPFGYRLLGPYLAGVLPLDQHTAFFLLNSAALFLLTVLLFRFIKSITHHDGVSFIMTAGFLFNRYFFQFLAFNPYQINDTISLALMLVSLEAVQRKRFLHLSLLLALTSLSREIWVLVFPFSLALALKERSSTREWVGMLGAFVPAFLIFLFLRWYFAVDWAGQSQEQFGSGIERFFSLEGFIKRFYMAFIPAAFLPVLFWKRTLQFFRRYPEWGVFLLFAVLSGFFGNDHERLMLPVAPLFFAVCAYGILPLLAGQSLRVNIVFGVIFYLGSFHHIWGILRLPSRSVTLGISLLLSFLTVLAVYFIKKEAARLGQPLE